ncbi:MAG: fasciclin domain-containing protein [Bacteriovoracaceae bacterium]|nr:fasciclin domain-containing protein [Bacteriovoracaceae bacterium]
MGKVIRAFFILSSFLFIYPLVGSNEISSKIEHPKTILDEVLENPSLSTLAKIIVNTDLVDVLEGQGPLTLFAPSNEAFTKLPSGKLEDLIKPGNKEKLMAILKYHVVFGKMTLDEMKKDKGLMTLEGQHLRIKVDNDKVIINNAAIVKPNLEYPNGVVYIIDQVLIPK